METSSDTRDRRVHVSCPSCSAPRGCWTLDFPKNSAAKTTALEEVKWAPEVESESLHHVSEKHPSLSHEEKVKCHTKKCWKVRLWLQK